MKLSGCVVGISGDPIPNSSIEVKNASFKTLYSAYSDEHGYFEMDLPKGVYPFLVAVRDYAEKYLEYWCNNLVLTTDIHLNICIDSLEVYGLNIFEVAGGYPSFMVYFRPMSLERFIKQEGDIAPEIDSIKVIVDEEEVTILTINSVKEYCGDREMSAYLIQIAHPKSYPIWNKLELSITDKSGHYGAASYFQTLK